jgi:hypothetical protein
VTKQAYTISAPRSQLQQHVNDQLAARRMSSDFIIVFKDAFYCLFDSLYAIKSREASHVSSHKPLAEKWGILFKAQNSTPYAARLLPQ